MAKPDGNKKKDGTPGKGEPVGVVVAIGSGRVGWSLCKKDDRWDPEVGLVTALGRAYLCPETVSGQFVPSDAINMFLSAPHTVSRALAGIHAVSRQYFARPRNGNSDGTG